MLRSTLLLVFLVSSNPALACIRFGYDVVDELKFLLCLHNEQVDAINGLSGLLRETEQRAVRAEVLVDAQDNAIELLARRINELENRVEELEKEIEP